MDTSESCRNPICDDLLGTQWNSWEECRSEVLTIVCVVSAEEPDPAHCNEAF